MATPDITKAWGAFFEEIAVCDPEELKRQGWMTNAEISELSKLEGQAGLQLADGAVRRGTLEKKAVKIMLHGKRQRMNFYRPKVK